jgi:hypothetical protein
MAAFYHLKTDQNFVRKMTIWLPDGPVFGCWLYVLDSNDFDFIDIFTPHAKFFFGPI